MYKFRKIKRFVEEIKKYGMSVEDNNAALAAGQAYGRLLWTNHIGIYRDDDFENALIEKFNQSVNYDKTIAKEERLLHIITMPLKTGGHTRLLEKLVSVSPQACDVLVTQPFQMDINVLRVADTVNVINQTYDYTVQDLVTIVSRYNILILHIHPDDLKTSVAIGLVRLHQPLKVIFVNHADHVFSYGFRCADIVAEISAFGFMLSQTRRNVISSYLGIPLKIPKYTSCRPIKGGGLNIFSSGIWYKFKPSSGHSFPLLARLILKNIPNSSLTIIGASSKSKWWWLSKLLHPKRLRFLPAVSHEQFINLIGSADVYIDSLPMTGGTTIPEVRGLGIPVTGIQTSALGYTPFDDAKFADANELLMELKILSNGDGGKILEMNNSPALLEAASDNHNLSQVEKRFKEILIRDHCFQPLITMEKIDVDYYEKQWSEKAKINIDPNIVDYVIEVAAHGHRKLFYSMLHAMTWRQIVRELLRCVTFKNR